MMEKARDRLDGELWRFVNAQSHVIMECLDGLYRAPRTLVAVESDFQRAAWRTLAHHRLVPQHLFVALRCARLSLQPRATSGPADFEANARAADDEATKAGARHLGSYGPPLLQIVNEMSARALADAEEVGAPAMTKIVDRLAEVFLLDARTRFPRPT